MSKQRITVYGIEPDFREEVITVMEIYRNNDEEERIANLEKRCREMDRQVMGLLNELLDLKSVTTGISRQAADYYRQDLLRETVVEDTASMEPSDSTVAVPQAGSVVIRPKSTSRPEINAAPAEPEMVRIMQSDGTFKMEVRRGDSSTMNSTGGWGNNKKSTTFRSKKNP
ncbi:MAG: hypothetical protein M0Q92_12980 [Methanoregula sp.]|nr:hypothetical protein [Methanoregula sp.]